jgi:hypothetical protein
MGIVMSLAVLELKRELGRQLEHWRLAAGRLTPLESIASLDAWRSLEHYLGVALRQTIGETLGRLNAKGDRLHTQLASATNEAELARTRAAIMRYRREYLRAETTVDFYADALATRASPRTGALLRACDHIATRSMSEALSPLGRQVPAVLSYLDAGLGASILKAGLRLWDGRSESPVATVKITRHNLLRPTSAIHEAGHQVSHMLGWNDELTASLLHGLQGAESLCRLWSSWASEIAADAFAFVCTGYAAVTALHDVVDGGAARVFTILPGDPHPASYLRLRLGVAMCRAAYGTGPWDQLERAWCRQYPLALAPADTRSLFEQSVALLPRAVALILQTPYRAFGNRPLVAIVNPERVSPRALDELESAAGKAAFSSPYWIWNESIRLLALTGYRAAESAASMREALVQQERWMLKIGGLQQAA